MNDKAIETFFGLTMVALCLGLLLSSLSCGGRKFNNPINPLTLPTSTPDK